MSAADINTLAPASAGMGGAAGMAGRSGPPASDDEGDRRWRGLSEGMGLGFRDDRRRLIRLFDFEEAKPGQREPNYTDMPRDWYAIGRDAMAQDPHFDSMPLHQQMMQMPGYPAYANVGFDKPQSQKGNHRLELKLNGGSVGAYLSVGAVTAVPNSDYVITATVQTTRLQSARARLTAFLVDDEGRILPGSETASRLVSTDTRSEQVQVRVLGDFPEAAWIGVKVELLQRRAQPGGEHVRHELMYEEVRGAAWFDDITIWQAPRVEVTTQSMVNIIRAPDKPTLALTVRDLTGRDLSAHATIYDHTYKAVTSQVNSVGSGEPKAWHWQPDLPRYGWYLVDLRLLEQGESEPVGRTVTAFLYLPAEPVRNFEDAQRFGIDASDLPRRQRDLVPELIRESRVRSVVLSLWERETTAETLIEEQAALDQVVHELRQVGAQTALCLSPLPRQLASALELEAAHPLWLFSHDADQWRPFVAPALMRHGQRVRLWQVGRVGDATAFHIGNLPQLYSTMVDSIRRMAPQPRIVLPWKASQSRRPDLDAQAVLLVDISPGVQPTQIGAHLAEHLPPAVPGVSRVIAHLKEPPATEVSHERRIADLVLRMLHVWEADVHSLSISQPWTRSAARRGDLLPDPLLGAFAQTSMRLSGRRVIGRLPLGPGLEAMILDGEGGSAIAAWTTSAAPENRTVKVYLGKSPVLVDVWGNRMPMREVDGNHTLTLSPTPVFVENIDAELAVMRASFRLDEPFLESTQVPHDRVLYLHNPWARTMTGSFVIMEPSHWTISPRRHVFSIAAGRTAAFPVRFQFPVSELSGDAKLTARFEFTSERRYRVDMTAPMHIGLEDVRFDATLSLEPDPQTGATDGVVTQLITNLSGEEMALYAFATLPGYPRQERIIAQLKPGQSVVRRFRFPDAMAALLTHRVRTGIRQTSGPAVLNKVLSIDSR